MPLREDLSVAALHCCFVDSYIERFSPGLDRPAFFVSEAPKAITLSEVFRSGRE
nr:MAG TPA: hypothetical protein [Caudoviricetes sp.]